MLSVILENSLDISYPLFLRSMNVPVLILEIADQCGLHQNLEQLSIAFMKNLFGIEALQLHAELYEQKQFKTQTN